MSRWIWLVGVFMGSLALLGGLAQVGTAGNGGAFQPIGAGYEEETLAQLAQLALAQDSDGVVTLKVLPITYATDAYTITAEERADNYSAAVTRADQLFAACETVIATPTVCMVEVIDIQTRPDAQDTLKVEQLLNQTDGVFVLGGDQTIAMQVIANTPAEAALNTLHQTGKPLGGTSAGAGIQSRYMIAGYTESGYAEYGLEYGALELWYGAITETERGLAFGVDSAVIDQHV